MTQSWLHIDSLVNCNLCCEQQQLYERGGSCQFSVLYTFPDSSFRRMKDWERAYIQNSGSSTKGSPPFRINSGVLVKENGINN
jgi:hypothetical protein